MQFEINATKREEQGTGASRRLRHAGKVPGIVYGGHQDPQAVEFVHQEMFLMLKHEAFHSSILTLNIGGQKEPVLLRDLQMHPVRNQILHADFQRVESGEKLHMKVPLHFLNEASAPGVKLGHGIVSHVMTELDITCLPKDLPEFIEVDLSGLELGQSIHVSQLKLPAGVEATALLHKEDPVVVAIPTGRGSADAEGESAEGSAEGGTPAASA